MVEFMHRTGSIRVRPERWQDLFFPNMHDRPGQ
jgi:NitT/TauT family transport system substrate-binding protein